MKKTLSVLLLVLIFTVACEALPAPTSGPPTAAAETDPFDSFRAAVSRPIPLFFDRMLSSSQEEAQACSLDDPPPRGCTIFTISHGARVFFGGNSDWINFDSSYYWVDPGDAAGYGAIYFGKPNNVQHGFNEKGLAYDANGLPPAPVNDHTGISPVYGTYNSYPIKILRECTTVKEVIAWVRRHQWHEMMYDQLHFADATGDAVVISAGPDGEVIFTRKATGNGFLVSTNFNLANPANGSYPCWRYARAQEMLEEMDSLGMLTAEQAAAVLDAVHVASPSGFTTMSLVGDLPQGLVYVYLFHQFDAPIVLNVADEIASEPAPGPLRDLFPPETLDQTDKAYDRMMARTTRCDAAGFAWLTLVVLSLAALLFLARSRRRGLLLWALLVVVLGPVGLLVWLFAARSGRASALVEVVGDMVPYVIGMTAALLIVILVPVVSKNSLLQLFALYGLPFVIGLFLYQAPLLARATGHGYAHTLWHRLPATLVSTNLALAGLLAVCLPLFVQHLDYCGVGSLAVLSWWALAVLGALVGGLLLYLYQVWTIPRGFAAWSVLLCDTIEDDAERVVTSPPCRCLWFWIPLSFMILIAGMAVAAVGTSL